MHLASRRAYKKEHFDEKKQQSSPSHIHENLCFAIAPLFHTTPDLMHVFWGPLIMWTVNILQRNRVVFSDGFFWNYHFSKGLRGSGAISNCSSKFVIVPVYKVCLFVCSCSQLSKSVSNTWLSMCGWRPSGSIRWFLRNECGKPFEGYWRIILA